MVPYLICFTITPLCTYIAEKFFEKGEKLKAVFFSFLAILVPCIIAGIRDISVGVDGKIYVEPVLRQIKNMSLVTAFNTFSLEKGYLLLVYCTTFITDNANVLLFIIHCILIISIYCTAYKLRENYSMTLFMTVFILFVYTKSLNIMRQCIALALFIYSLTFLLKRNYIKTIIIFLIAMLFHRSIVFCVAIYFLFIINNLRIKSNIKMLIFILLVMMALICAINIQNIVQFLVYEIKIVPESYYRYFLDIEFLSNNYIDLIFKLVLTFMSFVVAIYDKDKKNFSTNLTFLESVVLGLIFTISMMFIGQLGEIYRISFSFITIGIIYLFSKGFYIVKNNSFNKTMVYTIIYAVLLANWIVYYVINGEASLYPYILMK